MANITTLVDDIENLFREPHVVSEENVTKFASSLSQLVASRLAAREHGHTLRMSNLGRPDRQLWYDKRHEKEQLDPHTLFKFMYGDIVEQVVLFLAKEAGHEVTHEQETVVVDGVVGHCDAVIDGVVVDVKSASTYAYKKFKYGELREDDQFGYYDQLAGYATGLGLSTGAFLAFDKQNGHICLLEVPEEEIKAIDTRARIEHIKGVLEAEAPPKRCYEPVPEGTKGNQVLAVGCSYCSHKQRCWSDANGGIGLRTFLYSTGPKHFTHVESEPRVPELTF